MMERRVGPITRGEAFQIFVNGRAVPAYQGETIAGALLAAGITVFRRTMETGAQRGQFCGMGVCYDCLVDFDEEFSVRACMTAVVPGMKITVPDQQGDEAS